MKPVGRKPVHSEDSWRCRHCGYVYNECEYWLPIVKCPICDGKYCFDKVTTETEYHPGQDLMLLP
jgi:rubrerythrin